MAGERLWCGKCRKPVTAASGGVVHEVAAADGHQATAVSRAAAVGMLEAEAREIEGEFPGYRVWLPYGPLFLRADPHASRVRQGCFAVHYEDDTADGLRRQLAAAGRIAGLQARRLQEAGR